MATEKRKPEDTVCPLLSVANVIVLAISAMISAKDGSSWKIPDWKVVCLGLECHMYQPNDRKCGLRHR